MLTDKLRELMKASPFIPFTVHVSDGSEVLVHHHDYAWLLPSGFQFFVETKEGRVRTINVSHITQVSYPSEADTVSTGAATRG